MHIKSLTIQGFKSYRDETVIDPFSPGVNVVVGRNGSGKSNFFAAIRFVLSDAYSGMMKADRQSLLHEGSSTQATFSAFVEIVFDNSDNRFPTGKETVILRRTVGAKKDEYSLDRKSTGKGEVMSLLESAGFSRSNPYYIVPQGRITNLTNQKDSERLDLLKEVAGTKVYEDRRTESMKIMADTEAKKNKIQELLDYIEERLNELEEEKEELRQFTTHDRERRCLEYAIYQRELDDLVETLEQLEDERRNDVFNANARREEYTDRQKTLSDLEAKIASLKSQHELLLVERKQAEVDARDYVKAATQLQCTITDMEDSAAAGTSKRETLESDLEDLEGQISEKETELMEVVPDFEDRSKEEAILKTDLEKAQTTVKTLYAKQGRAAQFTSQAERDTYLQQEINKLTAFLQDSERKLQEAQNDVAKAQDSLKETSERSQSVRKDLDGRKSSLQELADESSAIKIKRDELIEKRKELWKEDSKLEQVVGHANEQLKDSSRKLSSTIDRGTQLGLQAIEKIAQRLDLDGVYGPLYQLFEVDDKYRTAVEVTAGSSLFHVVVDTDETATKLLDVMIKEKSGRVTFMPLNRLHPKPVQYPEQVEEALPLIKKLKFDAKFKPAMEQVFSKTIVCQDLSVAGAYARSHNLTGITLQGDKADRKGALTGGYHDNRRSRLEAVKTLKQWQVKYDESKTRSDEVKRLTMQMDQEVTRYLGRLQVIDSKRKRAADGREPLIAEAASLQRDEAQLKSRLERLEALVADRIIGVNSTKVQLEASKEELKTPMTQNLSDEEAQTLTHLTSQIDILKRDLARKSEERNELASRRNLLEVELNENLRRKRDEIRGKLEGLDGNGEAQGNDDISSRKTELKNLQASIETAQATVADLDKQIEQTLTKITKTTNELDQTTQDQAEDGRTIARQQKNIEKYLAKRQLLNTRKDQCSKHIRDLGVLPEEAFEKHAQKIRAEKLYKQLHKVNEELKKYTTVNKKAFEQYNQFTKQRDSLMERQSELDNSAESIQELIDNLDQRKDEAIERTFKQVSKNFAEVFEKLVPLGRGRLIMQKRIDQESMDVDGDEDEDEDAPKKDKSIIENYIGVSIKVSFNSKSDEGLRIQQLSGGQKSLVALAMVFAIQKCDSAPFYLFDEIDANLDADRRTAVAAMIRELSTDAQFIITTFRPELLAHGGEDTFLGVTFDHRKISSISKITQDDALQFVEQAEGKR